MTVQIFKSQKGFTLIELLVVIGILGILAAAILVALNPLEKFASGRDAGRLTALNQIGHSLQSYYVSQNSSYPAQNAAWLTALQTAGEIKGLPSNPAGATGYNAGCNTTPSPAQNGICYFTAGTDAIVYVRAESNASVTKAACPSGQSPWIIWSSADGKAGLGCATTGNDPLPGITGLK